ncbi:MAG TPA: DUF2235 domain-containing protein [Caldimonas sp.]|nr:DUF2235 domain-containing protein [Caldimonas sp.]HEX4235640.1 DUF2235 domain-containing protein [Caldimonas sp.]
MPKNILLFMDGTRNKPSDERFRKDTNVWKLYDAASASRNGREIYAKYVRGVGTHREEDVTSPADDLRLFRIREWYPPARAAKRVARRVAQIPKRIALKYGASPVGWGVSDRIRDAYGFICRHYDPGDQVFVFGFSRGAFEARSLSGFVDSVGLLLKSQATGPDTRRLVDMAYEIYRRGDEKSLRFLRRFLRRVARLGAPGPATDFRKATEVRLHFVGVWDTVEALGIGEAKVGPLVLKNKSLPVVGKHTTYHLAKALPANVQHGRHALAIHELRAKFEPLLWDASSSGQDLSQLWFAGAHADVGGGYPETGLSDIALDWMADEASRCSAKGAAASLAFNGMPRAAVADAARLPHHAIQGDFFWATPTPRESMLNFHALAPQVSATLAVHPSAIDRLFDSTATSYEVYPFEKDFKWTRALPGSKRYPQDVAGALSALDDHAVRMHASSLATRALTHAASTAADQAVAWRLVQDVTDLRLFDAYVARKRAGFARGDVDVSRLADALALLLAFGRSSSVGGFVQVMTQRSQRLVRVARLSTDFGLKIRNRWLPRFADLCKAARVAERICPATHLAKATQIRGGLCKARDDLQQELPYLAPRKIPPFPKKPKPGPPTGPSSTT